jgi:hypothetical protein
MTVRDLLAALQCLPKRAVAERRRQRAHNTHPVGQNAAIGELPAPHPSQGHLG